MNSQAREIRTPPLRILHSEGGGGRIAHRDENRSAVRDVIDANRQRGRGALDNGSKYENRAKKRCKFGKLRKTQILKKDREPSISCLKNKRKFQREILKKTSESLFNSKK